MKMIARFIFTLLAALAFLLIQAQAQNQTGQTPRSNADPYANNPDAGKTQFPMAAPAGVDSGAITKALPGGVNQGTVSESNWQYGHDFRRRTGKSGIQ
jgi:hypothetical protein